MPSEAASGKRAELIEIASRLFYEQGYGATGIKQVIEEAGIAKGTFYSHFRSKEELGLAWLKDRHAVWSRWLDQAVGDGADGGAQLLASFDFLQQWMGESNYRGCAFINTMAETPEAKSPLRAEVEAHKLQLLRWFQRTAVSHFTSLTEAQAREKGTLMYLLFEGALVEAQLFQDPWPLISAREEVVNILAQGS